MQRISLTKVSGLTEAGKKQVELVKEELDGIRGLVAEGYAPKVQQISLEKELNEILSKNELQGTRDQSIQTIEELKFKLKQPMNAY